jgi:hypothetical protein
MESLLNPGLSRNDAVELPVDCQSAPTEGWSELLSTRFGRVPRTFSGLRSSRSTSNARIRLGMVRADGIEPTRPAWKAGVLPLNYAREAQGGRHSSLLQFGQARNFATVSPQEPVRSCFSPGFYPVSHCERQSCAVVWIVWHSFHRPPPRPSKPHVRQPRKRPRT